MSRHSRREEKAARRRAKKLLEIRPGAISVYTAYLVVCIRLLILVAHSTVPGLQ
jgi:hypothetical protein